MTTPRYLTAQEATDILGVSPATLYAYVSRGLIRSEATEGGGRTRRYHAEDVYQLVERKAQRKNPAEAARGVLHWGTPVLESALTLIADGRLYYRGQDVRDLATHHTVEQVAALLWTGDINEAERLFAARPVVERYLAALDSLGGLAPMQKLPIALALAAENDLAAYDLRPANVPFTGARILGLMTAVLAGRASENGGLVARLCDGWGVAAAGGAGLLNAALIVCADHELNVSSFTARVVASADAQPYQVVMAGLNALQGVKHGGMTERVEALLREAGGPGGVRGCIANRLQRGEEIVGFGHRLYPNGDPRGRLLLRLLDEQYADTPVMEFAHTVIETAWAAISQQPTIDFALVTLARALNLPPGAPLSLFALGRTIGWIGHAIEQYAQAKLIRPRAQYVGLLPSDE
jgi:citrate synthase